MLVSPECLVARIYARFAALQRRGSRNRPNRRSIERIQLNRHPMKKQRIDRFFGFIFVDIGIAAIARRAVDADPLAHRDQPFSDILENRHPVGFSTNRAPSLPSVTARSLGRRPGFPALGCLAA